jgi:hypothetical protein
VNQGEEEFERIKKAHQNVIQNEGGRPARRILYFLVAVVLLGLFLQFQQGLNQRQLITTLGADIETRSDQREADFAEIRRVGNSINETLDLIKKTLCPDQAPDEECVPPAVNGDERTAQVIGQIVDANKNGVPDTTEIIRQQEQIKADLDRILGR